MEYYLATEKNELLIEEIFGWILHSTEWKTPDIKSYIYTAYDSI